MKRMLAGLSLLSSVVLAAPPPPMPGGGPPMRGPGRGPMMGMEDDERAERMEEHQRRMHTAMVVGLAEALELTDAEALKLSEKLKGFEEKRRPIRQQMRESMRTLKSAAGGEQAALAQVDAAIAKVLDSRAQLAALDKEQLAALSQGLTPQKRARLALFFAHFGQQAQKFRGGPAGRR